MLDSIHQIPIENILCLFINITFFPENPGLFLYSLDLTMPNIHLLGYWLGFIE